MKIIHLECFDYLTVYDMKSKYDFFFTKLKAL